MRNRALAPRTRNQYDNEQHGRRDSSMPPDDRTLNSAVARMMLVRPKYNEGSLVFRPWPALDYDNPQVLAPGRKSVHQRGNNMWTVRAPMAKFIGLNEQGSEKFSFILYEPWLGLEKKKKNPYRVFFYACQDAFDTGKFRAGGRKWDGDWNALMKGSKRGGAEISRPTASWFMQGEVFANGEKDYTTGERLPLGRDDADDLVVIQLTTSAGDNILDLLDTPKPNAEGDEVATPWAFFKYGDPTGIYDAETGEVKGGLIYTLFNPKKVKVVERPNPKVPGERVKMVDVGGKQYPMANTSWDGKIADVQGYEATLSKSYEGSNGDIFTPSMDKAAADRVLNKWQFWWDDGDQKGILRVPSIEEQCVMIAKAYSGIAKVVEFAWADMEREFMTDEVKGILNQRRSAVNPGMPEDELDDETEAALGGGPRGRQDPTQSRRPAAKPAASEDEFEDDVPAAAAPAAATRTRRGAPAAPAPVTEDEFEDPSGEPALESDDIPGDEVQGELFEDDVAPEVEPETAGDVDTEVGEAAETDEVQDAGEAFPEGDAAEFEEEVAPPPPPAPAARTRRPAPKPAAPPATDEFEEDTTAPAPTDDDGGGGGDEPVDEFADAEDKDAQAKMREAMAKARSQQRTSPPPASAARKPAAAPATAKPAATGKPAAATAAATKPAATAARPAGKPAGTTPAAAAPTRTAKPATAPARTAAPAATGKPAQARPATARPAAKK